MENLFEKYIIKRFIDFNRIVFGLKEGRQYDALKYDFKKNYISYDKMLFYAFATFSMHPYFNEFLTNRIKDYNFDIYDKYFRNHEDYMEAMESYHFAKTTKQIELKRFINKITLNKFIKGKNKPIELFDHNELFDNRKINKLISKINKKTSDFNINKKRCVKYKLKKEISNNIYKSKAGKLFILQLEFKQFSGKK